MSYVFKLIGAGLVAAVSCVCGGSAAICAPVSVDGASFRPEAEDAIAIIAPGQVMGLQKVSFHPMIEFRGSYICPQGLTALDLLVVDDYAIFNFGAHPANPGVPSGSVSMRGTVDLAGGVIRLEPVRWIVRPGDTWLMVGLDGVSEDGGRTFHGRVTGYRYCSIFSVTRVH